MEPIYYVIAIMGCGDGNTACAQARLEPAHYQSIVQCRAAMPDALTRSGDLSFPVVTAACRRQGEQMARNDRVARR